MRQGLCFSPSVADSQAPGRSAAEWSRSFLIFSFFFGRHVEGSVLSVLWSRFGGRVRLVFQLGRR